MGAAWREVKDGPQFDSVLEMVKGVRALGMEACATLGMLTESQAKRLREAGLSAYNHNLDTSAEHYGDIISTRTYEDRLRTLERVRQAGISVCSGGIIGLGESVDDRCKLLLHAGQPGGPPRVRAHQRARAGGGHAAGQPEARGDGGDGAHDRHRAHPHARCPWCACPPAAMQMNEEAQLLCMLAGANSLFFGEKLLTTGNPEFAQDMALLEKAGIRPLEPDVSR